MPAWTMDRCRSSAEWESCSVVSVSVNQLQPEEIEMMELGVPDKLVLGALLSLNPALNLTRYTSERSDFLCLDETAALSA